MRKKGGSVLAQHWSCKRGGVKMIYPEIWSVPAGLHTSQPDIHVSDRLPNIIAKIK
jgi:hypothetical protein